MLVLLSLLNDEVVFEDEERLARKNQSLLFDPASSADVFSVEQKLAVTLPESYREFLSVSNGLLQPALGGRPGRILPLDEIGFYKRLFPEKFRTFVKVEMSASDKDYFKYGVDQDSVHYRTSYADSLIAVSTHHSTGVYLLNPDVVFHGGEWEAWYFDFHGGASRYRSFYELMVAEKERSTKAYREMVFAHEE